MSYRTIVELVQHTPLIHFQCREQYGNGVYEDEILTLRASQVKPKLDRYLAECYKRENNKKGIPEKWQFRAQIGAAGADGSAHLNYKMKFSCSSIQKQKLDRNNFGLYWCNMNNREQTNVMGVYCKELTMTIICMIPELQAYIQSHIEAFFLCHNFGRMQSKGFGSFTIGEPDDSKIVNALCGAFQAPCCYSFPDGSNRPDGGKQACQRIKIVWSVMKSGYNFGGKYRRSLLFMYMHEKHKISNEKAWMKMKGYAGDPPYAKPQHRTFHDKWQEQQQEQTRTFKAVRPLLGAGDHVDFLIDPEHRRNEKNKVKIVKYSKQWVEQNKFRFHSPVMFKVIGSNVYYVGGMIPDEMWGASFSYIRESNQVRRKTEQLKQITLHTPEKIDGFMSDFLEYFWENYNKKPQNPGSMSKQNSAADIIGDSNFEIIRHTPEA